MQGFNSLEKAAESLRHLNCRWYSAFDSEKPLSFDGLLRIARIFDADSDPDIWKCFISLEDSGEIAIVYPQTELVDFLFFPEGSRYKGQNLNQAILYAEAETVIKPMMQKMLVEEAKKSARREVIASHYSIDADWQVVGHTPVGIRWAYDFERPGMKTFANLLKLGRKENEVYSEILERAHSGKKAKVVIGKKGSKNTAAAVGKREVWRKINSNAAARAGIDAPAKTALKDFQGDSGTERRTGLAGNLLRTIKG